ncbi:MAG: radical SAM protein [Omnitrophica WOR_2 bacterium]
MACFLFNEIVFGPVSSRRFGVSLGINLLPDSIKYCTFNCVYCECGLTDHEQDKKAKLYSTNEVLAALEERFSELHHKNLLPDNITFAGNGEPTIHPGFAEIIDRTIQLRDTYFPQAKITVLSNATKLNKDNVREALKKIDNNVLKLDAGSEQMFSAINRPLTKITLQQVVDDLKKFDGKVVIQTLFIKGDVNGTHIDNTTEEEIELWLNHLVEINPMLVMLYSISRETPEHGLLKVKKEELDFIAQKVREAGLQAEVYS